MRLKSLLLAGLMAGTVGLVGCTAEVEDTGEAPSVDVDPGAMPEVDIDPAKVEVGSDTQTVVTPDIDVTPTEGDDPDTTRDTTP